MAPGSIRNDFTVPHVIRRVGDPGTLCHSVTSGSFLIATLNPGQSLTINSDTDKTAVFTASMKSGGMLAVGTNTVAYSQQDGDPAASGSRGRIGRTAATGSHS